MNQASIKTLTQQISNARQGINEKKNVSDNVERMKVAFDQLGPALKGQMEGLQTMSPQASTQKEGQEKLLEQKRYFERFIEIINNEYEELIQVCRETLSQPSKERKPDQAWEKVLYSKDQYFSVLKENLSQETNYFELVFRMLNSRDILINQIIRSMIYKKLLLWKDMAIPNEPFVHAQIKNILTIIETLISKAQLVPLKPEFRNLEWDSETQGVWKYQLQSFSNKEGGGSTEVADTLPISVYLKLLNEMYEELLESLRNYSNLSTDPQKISQITTNQPIVKSLRGEIEKLTNENLKLHQNYNDLRQNMKATDFDNIKKLNQRTEELETILARKDREINELSNNSKGSLNLITNLREKLKELEEENHKFNGIFFPKLRELEGSQLKLMDEFSKIKKDIDTYSSLFKLESQMREKALKDKEYAEKQVQKLVDMLGKQKAKTVQTGEMVRQKESIINKILESRRETISGVDELKHQITLLEKKILEQQYAHKELTEKLQLSEKKYGDMFEINTHFNKRIYELEKQKKELLDILRQHNIEPDPTKLSGKD